MSHRLEITTRICAFLSSLMAFVCVATNIQNDVLVTIYGILLGLMVISILTCLASFSRRDSTKRKASRADANLCAIFAVAFLVLAILLLPQKSSQNIAGGVFSVFSIITWLAGAICSYVRYRCGSNWYQSFVGRGDANAGLNERIYAFRRDLATAMSAMSAVTASTEDVTDLAADLQSRVAKIERVLTPNWMLIFLAPDRVQHRLIRRLDDEAKPVLNILYCIAEGLYSEILARRSGSKNDFETALRCFSSAESLLQRYLHNTIGVDTHLVRLYILARQGHALYGLTRLADAKEKFEAVLGAAPRDMIEQNPWLRPIKSKLREIVDEVFEEKMTAAEGSLKASLRSILEEQLDRALKEIGDALKTLERVQTHPDVSSERKDKMAKLLKEAEILRTIASSIQAGKTYVQKFKISSPGSVELLELAQSEFSVAGKSANALDDPVIVSCYAKAEIANALFLMGQSEPAERILDDVLRSQFDFKRFPWLNRAGKLREKIREEKRRRAQNQKPGDHQRRRPLSNEETVMRWTEGKSKDIQKLLCSLHTVIWPHSGWTPCQQVKRDDVKKMFKKACLVVHPDKTKAANKDLGTLIMQALNNAWEEFKGQQT